MSCFSPQRTHPERAARLGDDHAGRVGRVGRVGDGTVPTLVAGSVFPNSAWHALKHPFPAATDDVLTCYGGLPGAEFARLPLRKIPPEVGR